MQRTEELLPLVQIQTRSNTVPVYALPHETASICPECNRTIPALVEFSFYAGIHKIDGRSTGLIPDFELPPLAIGIAPRKGPAPPR